MHPERLQDTKRSLPQIVTAGVRAQGGGLAGRARLGQWEGFESGWDFPVNGGLVGDTVWDLSGGWDVPVTGTWDFGVVEPVDLGGGGWLEFGAGGGGGGTAEGGDMLGQFTWDAQPVDAGVYDPGPQPNGAWKYADGTQLFQDGTTIYTDGTIVYPDGSTLYPGDVFVDAGGAEYSLGAAAETATVAQQARQATSSGVSFTSVLDSLTRAAATILPIFTGQPARAPSGTQAGQVYRDPGTGRYYRLNPDGSSTPVGAPAAAGAGLLGGGTGTLLLLGGGALLLFAMMRK